MSADAASRRSLSVDEQMRLLTRGAEYGDETLRRAMESELRERLEEGRPLNVYLGVDPSAPDLHLGHTVALRKLRQFQNLGHRAVLLIGNFTGLIGDPSDKDSRRPTLTAEEVEANARTYVDQAYAVLDAERTIIRHNAEWLAKLTFADLIQLASNFTVGQFLQRDSFAERRDRGDPIFLHELFYALMQGYDAIALDTDVQIGGTDQTFNIMAGRTLQKAFGQRPQVALTFPILVGTDGKIRMSKTLGNHIALADPPDDMYGKVMSIPDDVIIDYFTLVTSVPGEEIDRMRTQLSERSVNPMELKKRLAREIVREYHSAEEADRAEEQFESVFQRQETPEEMAIPVPWHRLPFVAMLDLGGRPLARPKTPSELPYPVDVAALLLQSLNVSISEAGRLISQGAVSIDGRRVTARTDESLKVGSVIRVGKHRFLRIVDAEKE